MWSILLLGTPQILRDADRVQLSRRKNRALLYYLAAHDKPQTRDQLLALFFVDHERAAAQQILRTMIHDLRAQLGDALVVEGETLALAPETFVDVREFGRERRFTEEGRRFTEGGRGFTEGGRRFTETSLQLYRGDFLEGFALADVPEFEDWAARERERYRELVIRGWMQVGMQFEFERDYARALEALNRALAFDALNEEAQRQALRVQYWNGDRAGAIRRFEQLQKGLEEELGVPPMAETRAVYDAIVTDTLKRDERPETGAVDKAHLTDEQKQPRRAARDASHGPAIMQQRPAAQPLLPFTGREWELERLNTLADAGKLIWIQGEPGIGKTRLAEEFIAAAPNADAIVLRGAAHELEQNLPYQPLMDALRGLYGQVEWDSFAPTLDLAPVWWTELARLTPELHTVFPNLFVSAAPTDEARVWEAVYQLFLRLSAAGRVILFLDDVQWADAATIGMLGYLARRAAASLVLVATTRTVEPQTPAATLLQALTRAERLGRVEMNALSARDLEMLAAQLTRDHAAPLAVWLHDNTEGNPLLINELVRYAYDNEVLQRDGTFVNRATPATLLTPTIQNLIESRLTRLNDNARRVLQTACVSGRESTFALLARASEMPENATLDALDALQRAGLLRATGGAAYAFDHHLTMQYAYQALGAARQRVLHRRVAEALIEQQAEEPDATAGLIARHFAEGGAPERAAGYALRAAGYAARLAAWAEAISFYEQALQGNLDAGELATALLGLGSSNIHGGHVARATEVLREAFTFARAHDDTAHADAVLVFLNQSLIPQARYAEAIELAREARESGPDELALAAEFAWGTALGLQGAQPTEAEKHLRAAGELLDAPRSFRSLVTRAKIEYQLAGILGQQGKWQEAVELYWKALAEVRRDEAALDLQRHILLYNNLAYYLHLLNDPAAAEYARAGIALAREKGSQTHLPFLLSTSGEIALAHEDFDAAESYFQQGLDLATQLGNEERRAGLTANLGLVARARGYRELAVARLTQALDLVARSDARHLTARIHLWLAPLLPPDLARAHLEEGRRIAEESGYLRLREEAEELAETLRAR